GRRSRRPLQQAATLRLVRRRRIGIHRLPDPRGGSGDGLTHIARSPMDITFDLLALQLFTGLALGAIYVLLAVGLSLIFGMLTVVNFAHGAFFMLGAYVGLFAAEKTGSFWLALLIAPIAVAAFGMLCERWLIRPLYGRGIDYPLLLTFGLAYMMAEAVRMVFGKAGLPFAPPELLQGATN